MSGDRLHNPASANFINKWKSEEENVMSEVKGICNAHCFNATPNTEWGQI